jgi:phospholipid/cholesterol/gamma-HCH transport system substrate-binding protein
VIVMRIIKPVVVLTIVGAVTAGCGFNGMQNMNLPGGVANGSDAMKLTVELPDVGTLTSNGEVKVGDVAVGTVNSIAVDDWHAVARISVDPKIRLPANAVARVGVNSLLGASYLELAAPTDQPAQGSLRTGDRIPLEHGEAYPSTEQVLSAASVVLNGGGLEQLSTITTQLNRAFSGNGLAVRDLLPRLDSFVAELDSQKTQIYSAIDSLDRLSTKFARNRGTITRAVDEIGPALATLSKERPKLTAALASLKQLSDVATPLVESTRADIVGNLRDLVPALRAIDSAGDSLVRGLGFAVTFPFAPETVTNACRGDYCNLDLVLDLTNGALVHGFTTKDGVPNVPGLPGLPTVPDLLGLLGLGPTAGTLVGGLGTLLGVPSGSSAQSSGGTPTTAGGTSAAGSNPLTNLLGGLLGGTRKTDGAGQ